VARARSACWIASSSAWAAGSRRETDSLWVRATTTPPRNTAAPTGTARSSRRSEEHTSELQSRFDLVCRLLLEQKNDELRDGGEPVVVHLPAGERLGKLAVPVAHDVYRQRAPPA